jgi:hypothetical protein
MWLSFCTLKSIEQSPSYEAIKSRNHPHSVEPEDSLPCSQEPVPVLSQFGPLCATSHFLKIHFNIILPFVPRSCKGPLSLKCPLRTSPVSHTCYMPRSSRSSWFDIPHNILWVVHLIQLLLTQSCAVCCYLYVLGPSIFLNTLFSNTLSLRSSMWEDEYTQQHKTTGKIIVINILNFISLYCKLKGKMRTFILWLQYTLYLFTNGILFFSVVRKYLNCAPCKGFMTYVHVVILSGNLFKNRLNKKYRDWNGIKYNPSFGHKKRLQKETNMTC